MTIPIHILFESESLTEGTILKWTGIGALGGVIISAIKSAITMRFRVQAKIDEYGLDPNNPEDALEIKAIKIKAWKEALTKDALSGAFTGAALGFMAGSVKSQFDNWKAQDQAIKNQAKAMRDMADEMHARQIRLNARMDRETKEMVDDFHKKTKNLTNELAKNHKASVDALNNVVTDENKDTLSEIVGNMSDPNYVSNIRNAIRTGGSITI